MAEVSKIDITAGTIFRVILILLGFWFLYFIVDVLFMLFAGVVIASAIEPVARFLRRYRVPRSLTVLGVYVLTLAVLSGLVTLLVPPVTEQITHLAASLPQLVERWEQWGLVIFKDGASPVASLQQVLLRFQDNIPSVGFDVFRQTRSIFSGAFTFLFILIIAFYFVVEEDALKKLLKLIVPVRHFAYAAEVIDRAQRNIARWVVAQLALGLIVGMIVTVGLWLIGVRYALVLGLVAGVLEVIPVIGPILAAIPGVFVGFSDTLPLGLLALVFYILVQQAENQFLVPIVMRKAVGLNPLVTLVAVLLGGRLAGLGGVILAVPAAVVVSLVLSDILVDKLHTDEMITRQ